jgi:hypothetical protein
VLQLPQLVTLVARSTQLAPHWVSPSAHVAEQAPAEHTWPAAQAMPQLPQFRGSERVSAQPVLHAESPDKHWQAPAAQVCPETQGDWHLPQLLGLVLRSTQEPPQGDCAAGHDDPGPGLEVSICASHARGTPIKVRRIAPSLRFMTVNPLQRRTRRRCLLK